MTTKADDDLEMEMIEVTNIKSRKLGECRGNVFFYIGIILLFISFMGLAGGENILIPLFTGMTLVAIGYIFMRKDYLAYLDLIKTGRVIYAKPELFMSTTEMPNTTKL